MARKPNILLICGTLNQTTQMHKIWEEVRHYGNAYLTPYYPSHPLFKWARRRGMLKNAIVGQGPFYYQCLDYLKEHKLPIDEEGAHHTWDLVFNCSDIIWQRNIRKAKTVAVQEGLPDLHNWLTPLIKAVNGPRYLAFNVSLNYTSNLYDKLCVASEGHKAYYRDWGKIPEHKLEVTGIPNFDNIAAFEENDFPHRDYVLVCTSDLRETYRKEDRPAFIRECVERAAGRQLIFKLHPNEVWERAKAEIEEHAPGALLYQLGDTNAMIANCSMLITQNSTVTYVGMVLGKEVYSWLDLEKLQRELPLQNGGTSAKAIATVGLRLLDASQFDLPQPFPGETSSPTSASVAPTLA